MKHILHIHLKVIKRNGLHDYFSTLLFCLRFFEIHTALRLPVYITHFVQYIKPRDKNRIILNTCGKKTETAQLSIGFLDRQYKWNAPSLINIQGQLRLHGGGNRYIASGLALYIAENGIADIGIGFSASHNLRMFVANHVTIGDNNMWSYDCVIMDTDAHQIYDSDNNLINKPREVVFGNNVWLGARNVVLKGAVIPNGCVIGANQTIRNRFTVENAIIAGGKEVRLNVKWYRPVK